MKDRTSALRILVGGDISPTARLAPLFVRGDGETLFHDLLPEFHDADLVVANLESPLVAEASPIGKEGPCLKGPVEAVEGLVKAGIDVLSLANNHIRDYGAEGVASTLAACRAAGLATAGAGNNRKDAGRVLYQEAKGKTIAILAFAEHEFSIAGEATAGANPLDLIAFSRTMREVRGKADFTLVLLHAGLEHYPLPSPNLQDTCRFLIEEGARAVVCQHSHCPGGYEAYQGGTIVYGQGNLVFDMHPAKRQSWYQGYLSDFRLYPDGSHEMAVIPFRQGDDTPGARKLEAEQEARFLASLRDLCAKAQCPETVAREWNAICKSKQHTYLSYLRGHSRLARWINKHTGIWSALLRKGSLHRMQNIVQCETHREAVLTILEQMHTEEWKKRK